MIKVAVIGCGRWGPNHVRSFNSLSGSRVDAVADLDEGRLKHMRDMYPELRCEQDYQLLLRDPNIDAVVVATPVGTHYEIVRAAILEGKHVLCEKPLCKSSTRGQELVDLARAEKRSLVVGHVFLFNPGIIKLKELVSTGQLGSIRYLSASRTNLGVFQRDVDVSYDLCSHDISIFNWLLDSEPEFVSAVGSSFVQPEIADVVFVSMRYPGNTLANMHASWLDPKKVRQMTVVGGQQMATWDDMDLTTPVAIYDRGASADNSYEDYGEFLRLSMWDRDVRLPKVHFDEPLKVQGTAFLETIQDGHLNPSDGEFGLSVVKILEAISISMEQDGSPTPVRG